MFFFISIFQAGCSKSSDSGKPEIKEMHFLTDGELYDSMYKKIKAAKNNIWIAALIFNAPDKSDNLTKKLLDLLIEKHQSGIMINVVLDSSRRVAYKLLRNLFKTKHKLALLEMWVVAYLNPQKRNLNGGQYNEFIQTS